MQIQFRQGAIIIGLGLLGWAFCGAIMFVGMGFASLETTLVMHLFGAPVVFATISRFFFTRLRYTKPFLTACLFLLVVMAMDFFLVALVINRSLDMFRSLEGTWIPFVLIFLSTFLTGRMVHPEGKA